MNGQIVWGLELGACHERLGTEPDADARTIKRAYSRELKKIDQAADPEGFQALREAYEAALKYAELRQAKPTASEARPEQASETIARVSQRDMPQAGPNGEMPYAPKYAMPAADVQGARAIREEEMRLVSHAYEHVMAASAQLAGDEGVQVEQMSAALRGVLDGELQLALAARTRLEQHIAATLVNGWQPGHEVLLEAAIDAFQWSRDQRRLTALSGEGRMLAKVLGEWQAFDTLPWPKVVEGRRLAARLRDGTPARARELVRSAPLLRELLQSFPNWMRLTTNAAQAQDWLDRAARLPRWQRMLYGSSRSPGEPASKPRFRWLRWLSIGVFVLNLVRLLMHMAPAPPPTHYGTSTASLPPELRPSPKVKPAAETPPSREWWGPGYMEIDAPQHQRIVDNIDFVWPSFAQGEQSVTLRVDLDSDGRVGAISMARGSLYPMFNESVAHAVEVAAPYAPGTPQHFEVTVKVNVAPGNKNWDPRKKPQRTPRDIEKYTEYGDR